MSTHETTVTDEQSHSVSDPILEIRNAEVVFEMDRGVSRVLDDVSLEIERGEILGVVGESGSGKSMLASSTLDAVVEPGVLTGEVTYYPEDGDPVDVLDLTPAELRRLRWEEIAMVFQGAMSSFNPTMKIRDHFEETLEAHDYSLRDGMSRAHELLSDLYLDSERVLDSYPHELSGGMQQRTLIALSVVLQPNVLVMDEPTAALDLLMQRSIISLLEELKSKYDLTMVFITHDLPLVAELADRLAVMYAFELIEQGPTQELLHDAGHPYTRALLNSTPNLDAPLEEMRPIPGSAPDPVDVPTGCSYHPRCSLATDRCVAKAPASEPITAAHTVDCHHWKDAVDAISLNHRKQVGSETQNRQQRPETSDRTRTRTEMNHQDQTSPEGDR
ncbi:ABC transporter ATP-binding protein [Natrarchaeobius halalkaliphilus]|uniref:ABC transporter ATP-binding protein n=1 Tax=Natrarchaeobius halalkaliphilus TaxID=1679091 RepID=A0A3N6LMD6_9EURY|nr:ABC transporter ATP-binding protein [Natrarchaeobius halalkaliphilus]